MNKPYVPLNEEEWDDDNFDDFDDEDFDDEEDDLDYWGDEYDEDFNEYDRFSL